MTHHTQAHHSASVLVIPNHPLMPFPASPRAAASLACVSLRAISISAYVIFFLGLRFVPFVPPNNLPLSTAQPSKTVFIPNHSTEILYSLSYINTGDFPEYFHSGILYSNSTIRFINTLPKITRIFRLTDVHEEPIQTLHHHSSKDDFK